MQIKHSENQALTSLKRNFISRKKSFDSLYEIFNSRKESSIQSTKIQFQQENFDSVYEAWIPEKKPRSWRGNFDS